MTLKPFNCTIRVFNPTDGSTIAEHILPVDSPDAEHAAGPPRTGTSPYGEPINR